MSGLLSLARDYLERMANPVYGFAVNEEYSLRFAQLLETDGFESSLRREVQELRDTEELTSNGWLWLMGGQRQERSKLKMTCCWIYLINGQVYPQGAPSSIWRYTSTVPTSASRAGCP